MTALHLAVKDLRLLGRDPVALFWVLGFPLLFALFLGGVVRAGLRGEPGPLHLVVFDHAPGPSSQKLMDELGRSPRLVVVEQSEERAQRAVRRAEAAAYLELSAGQPVRLGLDPSREVEGVFIRQAIAEAAARAADAPPPGGWTQAEGALPVAWVGPRHQREADLVFPAALLWGLIGCAACFAISMVTERTQGTLLRLVAAPLDKSMILWGKALACLVACLTVASLLTLLAVGVFEVRFERPLFVAIAVVSAALCFVGITMLLSLIGRTEQAVAGAGWAVLILMAMLGGGMVPLSMMPDWLLSVSHLSPAKWSILALEGATWRGFSARELLAPCGVLIAIAGFGFAAGSRLLTRATL